MNKTTDIEVIKEAAKLPTLIATEPKSSSAITPAQAKIEAVANLTMRAYERASTLQLTPEEVAAIQAAFPDEAFQSGAAGKENLIYIEHAHLRDRLNQVFGPGQWAIVPRNRWAEDFRTTKGEDASRVYVEAMLLIRGCFVAESVGDMVYYKNNATQNYGDAVEGAKTAALRRCAKELGIGLQAWKREFCEGWWSRKRGEKPKAKFVPASAPQPPVSAPQPTAAAPEPAKPAPQPEKLKPPTEATRQWFLKQMAPIMEANPGVVMDYFQKVGQLLETEALQDLPLRFVPASKDQLLKLRARINDFEAGDEAMPAFDPHDSGIEVPRDKEPAEPEEWRAFPMPWGNNAGMALGELDKKYLYGLWANYKVETEYNGKPNSAERIAKDTKFRKLLDDAGLHYGFTKND